MIDLSSFLELQCQLCFDDYKSFLALTPAVNTKKLSCLRNFKAELMMLSSENHMACIAFTITEQILLLAANNKAALLLTSVNV